MILDYFYGSQAELFSFYRIPKALFTDERFRVISAEAKVLYGIMLDRMSLSQKNGWLDSEGRVHIIFTLDELMAKTFMYLEEKGFADYDGLAGTAKEAEERFYALKGQIKSAETRMAEIQTLRNHIINYSKTRDVYTGYRKAGYSKKIPCRA